MSKAGCRVCRAHSGSEGFSGICWVEAVDLAAVPWLGSGLRCRVRHWRAWVKAGWVLGG